MMPSLVARAAVPMIFLFISLIPTFAAENAVSEKKIVLIGGKKSHNPGEHDFHHGIRLFQAFLETSPEVIERSMVVRAYPFGWPPEGALEEASAVIFYFDGAKQHPLLDAGRRAQVDRLMQQGVGLIALHQASTVPADDTSIDFPSWLGGVRYGFADRTTTSAYFVPAQDHPISRGVVEFTYYDEFYPTIEFSSGAGSVEPILIGDLHVEFTENKPVFTPRSHRTVAWAFERNDGGRSFGFTGGHFLSVWDNPSLRKLLLNAIFWTIGLEVPEAGVHTNASAQAATERAYPSYSRGRVTEPVVSRSTDNQLIHFPWGRLDWYVSGELNNSDSMTTGLATILPGKANPPHFHPACDEVLHVISGHIHHALDDKVVEMKAGDTVSIPAGILHSATNIGTDDAVLAISFSSAWREAVGE